ncbi:MAG: hypothetical protein KZQ75_02545 [Candidatus Thiodiazotropha sp. (ex Myrtea spinifera)]|nr:hypothetical protein [Candidatus Thiodiazotropha sp. (ex Myrtea spinifera)]
MDTNAYAPPKSEITTENNKPGSIVKAVVVGSAIEIVGTILVGLFIGLIYGLSIATQGGTADDIQKAMEIIDPWSSYGIAASFLGLIISLIAGYTCARIANIQSYKAAYILSGISFALGTAFGIGTYPWWSLLLLGLLSVCGVLFGARLYIRKSHKIQK